MSKNQIYFLVGGGCLVALCAAVALLVGVLYVAPTLTDQLEPIAEIVTIDPNPRPNADANSMGDPNAPIQMVEFGDFQCPFCKRFHTETEPLLIQYYIETGKVHFTYRSMGNFVSQNIGTESQDSALAAYCAADQNKFWEMHDALFVNNKNVENQGSFTSRRLVEIAKSIGLNITEFQDCYDSGKYEDRAQQDYDDAISAGIRGTPSFIVTYKVNGETRTLLIEGAQPFEAFQQELDKLLKEIGE